MRRISLLIALITIVTAAIFLNAGRKSDVTLVNARAVSLNGQASNFVVTFEIQNEGPAKTVVNVQSPSASMVHVMNPGYEDATIVIPAESNGIFAMDGAHVMVMGVDQDFDQGASIPITVTFEGYGDVTTRALNVSSEIGIGMMDHNISQGIRSIQSPSITLEAAEGFSSDGAELTVSVENFSFVRTPDDAPHVPMEGHGHIYLNGLKLGRLYDKDFSLGAIPSGSYELMVSINSNNHQPYIRNGEPVRDAISFQLD